MQWKGLYFFDRSPWNGLSTTNSTSLESCTSWTISSLPSPHRGPNAPQHCVTSWPYLLTWVSLDIPIATEKTYPQSTQLEFMGILPDSSRMEARLPDDKLNRLYSLVSAWQSKTNCRLRDLQSLIGSLHFACKVVAPGRPFLRCMISLTRRLSNPCAFIHVRKEFCKDLDMWAHFLASWNGVNLFFPPFPPCSNFISSH